MKKAVFVYFLLFFLPIIAKSQVSFYNYLDHTCQWSVELQYDDVCCNLEIYFVSGDTLISNNWYYKIGRYTGFNSPIYDLQSNYEFGLREDSAKRFYKILPGQINDSVFFDFNAVIGTPLPTAGPVVLIDTIYFDNQPLRRYNTSSAYYNYALLEGIGSNRGLYRNDQTIFYMNLGGGISYLMREQSLVCFFKQGRVLQYDHYFNCDLPINLDQPPIASFSFSDSVICSGDTFHFVDQSIYVPTSWKWIITNQQDTFEFNSQSIFYVPSFGERFNVTIIATNNFGSDTFTSDILFRASTITANIMALGPTSFCQGDSVIINSSPASSYLWNDGTTNSSLTVSISDTVFVSVTDSLGCHAISDSIFTVVFPNPGTPTITQIGNILNCSPAEGYQWFSSAGILTQEVNQSLSISQSDSFYVSIFDSNNCSSQSNFDFYTALNCSANFQLVPDFQSSNSWLLIDSIEGNPPFTYLWDWGDGSIDTIAFPIHVYDSLGDFSICLTIQDFLGCISTYCDSTNSLFNFQDSTNIVNVFNPLTVGLQSPGNDGGFLKIFPNPAKTEFKLFYYGTRAFIHDCLGNRLLTINPPCNGIAIDVSNISNGIYYIQTVEGINQKIIIQK